MSMFTKMIDLTDNFSEKLNNGSYSQEELLTYVEYAIGYIYFTKTLLEIAAGALESASSDLSGLNGLTADDGAGNFQIDTAKTVKEVEHALRIVNNQLKENK